MRHRGWLLLATRFDFDLTRADPIEEIRFLSGEPLMPIAGDGSGGTFFLQTSSGAVIYAGSEGEGGLIAHNLRDTLALVVGLPSLHDALTRPLGDELRAWLMEIDEGTRQDDALPGARRPGLDEARDLVRQALNLPPADGLLAELHAAAAGSTYRPISPHGPYEPMLRS